MRVNNALIGFSFVLLTFQSSCGDGTSPRDQSNGRVSIVNNPVALAAHVTYYDQDIPIETSGVGYSALLAPSRNLTPGSVSRLTAPPTIKLKLVAEVDPPSIGGQALQATAVAITGTLAVVSYNMRGAQYLGAIDVFEVSKDQKPVLRSRALLQNTDVNGISTDGVNVYVAEATSDTGFQAPGVFEAVLLSGSNLVLTGDHRASLSSFAGTSTAVVGTKVYATSGDGGSLFAFDMPSWTSQTVSLHDARWVDVAGGKVAVVQGTPGKLAVFDAVTLAPLGTFSFTGADIAESKSTVQLVGGKAFIAAGSGGVQVVSASTGAVVGSVARPDAASLGLDPSVVVTNAASVDSDLIFISNGEAGVYVAQGSQPFSATGSETTQQITMLGRLGFGSLQSVNHVAYNNGNLFIAAGLGGLKIVRVN
jgi:hypothetical protein